MRRSRKPANSDKTEISVARIGVISALGVAAMGMLATVLSAYFSAQAAQAPIILPILATQTAAAHPTPTALIQDSSAGSDSQRSHVQLTPPILLATEMPPATGDLEQALAAVNIILTAGTVDDIARMRGYLAEPHSAYGLLATASIAVMKGRRFKQPEYLDIFDKWYTALVGEANYLTADGTLNLGELKEAILKSHNDFYGDNVATFDQIVETQP